LKIGAACLGDVYSNYLVACLNINNVATKYSKGEAVPGPPFNEQCFQIATICGVPCSDLSNGQYPPSCNNGIVDETLLVSNGTVTSISGVVSPIVWASGLSVVDWVVLIVIFLDCFANILRFLPILSGRPAEVQSGKSIVCEGISVLGVATPIVSENEAIFLRSLVGRTATALHTVSSRHNVQGIYVDTIMNEFRGKGEEKRLQMWCAWVKFIELLANIKTRDMVWPCLLENKEDNGWRESVISTAFLIPENLNQTMLTNMVMRNVRISKNVTVEYDSGLSTVAFDGIKKVKNTNDLNIDVQNALAGQTRAKINSTNKTDIEKGGDIQYTSMPISQLCFDMEDLLPLVCFIDGWLEEIKNKDISYNYKDKT
jgi:hypothetical protein